MSRPATVADRLARAISVVDAPDVVLAVTRRGEHTLVTGGTTPEPATPREALHYELGSVTKTYTVLLLAALARAKVLALDEPLAAHLPGLRLVHPASRRITLRHLATHTAGLPRLPSDLLADALLHPAGNAYRRYDTARLLRRFALTRPRHTPGTRWRYSNFGVALLGPALAHAAGDDYLTLVTERVLRPLGLDGTRPTRGPGGTDAIGYGRDGRSAAPEADMGAFAAAGTVRATPRDMLRYLEAHLTPDRRPLCAALSDVQIPQLRRGPRHRDTHTLTWYHHPTPRGPLLFHGGATFGQQAFLGYHPASGTGLAAVATRRGHGCRRVPVADALLYGVCGDAGG
jgi:CubicO group peptidase (beta-lactamase class C family)